MADPVFERRGDYDNSRTKDSLAFRIDGRRLAVFKSHHPDRIGVALDQNDNSVMCWTITPQQLIQALETTQQEQPK